MHNEIVVDKTLCLWDLEKDFYLDKADAVRKWVNCSEYQFVSLDPLPALFCVLFLHMAFSGNRMSSVL